MRSAPPVKDNILCVTPSFRKEVSRSIVAIIAFVAVYFILFALSLLLVGATVYAGIWILSRDISVMSLLAGAGIISIGVLVFIFLVKFLFSRSRHDESGKMLVSSEDQPELVSFIHSIAEETGTDKPKKIFLSSDVNASVFYNSSFWSMFLPVRKNLQIGLGLVNCLNISEFKAVLAHEFGHFSQRSMKLGSYAYQVNRILYDMLFNNNGFYNSLRTWSSVSWITWLFVMVTVQIIKVIQFILVQMYKVVNTTYLSLSRQMEFHADLVAATISGSNNMISALKRAEFAEVCFQSTLSVYTEQWKDKKMMRNLYSDQRVVLRDLAAVNHIPMESGLPKITDEGKDLFFTRVNFKDQWASHPEVTDREKHLNSFSLFSETDTRSAWELFRNQEQLQVSFTESLYDPEEKVGLLDTIAFEQLYRQQVQRYKLPDIYKGYYNNRQIAEFDPSVSGGLSGTGALEDILTEDVCHLPLQVNATQQDIEKIRGIHEGIIGVNSFDFDGVKYKKKQAPEILATLEQELETLTTTLNETDIKIYRHFYKLVSLADAESLRAAYVSYFELRREADQYCADIDKMMAPLQPVFAGESLEVEQIIPLIEGLKNEEPHFKSSLRKWIGLNAFSPATREKTLKFIEADYTYFHYNQFFETELQDLHDIINSTWADVCDLAVLEFKAILEKQASYINQHAGAVA